MTMPVCYEMDCPMKNTAAQWPCPKCQPPTNTSSGTGFSLSKDQKIQQKLLEIEALVQEMLCHTVI